MIIFNRIRNDSLEAIQLCKNHSVEIITVGDEILRGKILNTNAQWIADKCGFYSLEVKRIMVIGDSLDDIASAIKDAILRGPSLIIITGGLGPTPDDVTVEAVVKVINSSLRLNVEAFEMIKSFYLSHRPELWSTREAVAKKMARQPEKAVPLSNPVGVAPGMLVEHEETKLIALPGVPREMKALFELHVEPILKDLSSLHRFEVVFKAYDVGEFDILDVLKHVSKAHKEIYMKILGFGRRKGRRFIKIYVATVASSASEVQEKMSHVTDELSKRISNLGGLLEPYKEAL
jgi:molybdenum cofactor synthesis domain-containing protein